MYRAAVITLSDKGARGERVDVSGATARELLEQAGYAVVRQLLLCDDRKGLTDALIAICDADEADLIVTTGGTGFSRWHARIARTGAARAGRSPLCLSHRGRRTDSRSWERRRSPAPERTLRPC